MLQRKIFLKWWLFFVLIIISSIICYDLGIFEEIYEKDNSYLSWFILAIFYYMSCWCGFKTWIVSNFEQNAFDDDLKKVSIQQEAGWFASEICLALGMTGTVFGFIMMLETFLGVDTSNQQSMQNMIIEMGKGMATALYTTLVGLVCSVLLKVQYFSLSQALDCLKKDEEKENV